MRPQILIRSWTFTPACCYYRAGKCSRNDPTLAYQTCPGILIRRNPRMYRIRPRYSHSTSRLSQSASTSPNPDITFHIAASSSGKGRRFHPSTNTYEFDQHTQVALGLQLGDNLAQRRRNRPDSGQDAFFVAKVGSNNNSTAFGIADGVGGWASAGVDPSNFSHGLCTYMANIALAWPYPHGRLYPRQLLDLAFTETINDHTIPAGGSTACVGVAEKDGKLHIANLGDSGFIQLRLGAVHHYSNPQTHAFNTPYQLSVIPPRILAQQAIFGGSSIADTPAHAELAEHMLRHGDVLVLATDGVWDNLNSQEVLNIVSLQMRTFGAWEITRERGLVVTEKLASLTLPGSLDEKKPQQTLQGAIAAAVAGEAKLASLNDKRDGPFAKEVQRHYPDEGFHGGKVDDICVIVLLPVQEQGTARAKL